MLTMYPAARYHRDGRMVIVPDEATAEALGPDWAVTPARWFDEPAVPAPEADRPVVPRKRGRPRKG